MIHHLAITLNGVLPFASLAPTPCAYFWEIGWFPDCLHPQFFQLLEIRGQEGMSMNHEPPTLQTEQQKL